MPARSAAERSLIGQYAAYESWARTPDRTARTANARKAAEERFLREVDPDGVLPEATRRQMAEAARKAYYTRLALKSAQARRNRRAGSDR
jgi:hypothetical protein